MPKEKICTIIPAHNEAERGIDKTLKRYLKFFKKKKQERKIRGFEILVVVNACKDNTEELVRKVKKLWKELRILVFKKGGKGFAVTEGFKDALKRDNDLIGFVDADEATSVEEYWKLIENIKEAEGIIASRYARGAIMMPKQSLKRRIISRAGNFYIRGLLFLPFKDTQCGAKVFKREPLKTIVHDLGMSQWGFDVELLYKLKKAGYKIIEFPTIWKDVAGSSLNVKKASTQALLAVTHLRIVNSPFKKILQPIKSFAAFIWRKLQ